MGCTGLARPSKQAVLRSLRGAAERAVPRSQTAFEALAALLWVLLAQELGLWALHRQTGLLQRQRSFCPSAQAMAAASRFEHQRLKREAWLQGVAAVLGKARQRTRYWANYRELVKPAYRGNLRASG